ncbi:ABC transporter substrate-binding protein [Pseudoflavonifractor sp. 524-17]|uniref:ABC transporter substrate-binding protein n=1 Tax=Pseudoflavonifractor sp. 524-17 TaxID=2304577 RepID=UPI00137AD4D6|nr:ABC transporter substrate-binding protein [Pseudoflavonifractor sp. 524-17]NCE63135.1 ABC transporter substrate-binding protein [Pseudoflavonifractor sp. 524-17]
MGRRGACFVLALALALGLCACGEEPEYVLPPETPPPPAPTQSAQPMPFALACYPGQGLHPILGTNRANLNLAGLIYDGLYELDRNFAPQSALAVAHTVSEDGLTWQFTLRQGVTFSDGSPLTAADAAYSLNLARESPLYAQRLGAVTAVRAEGEQVAVTLSAPNGALPALLDIPVIRPNGEEGAPLGTGRYVLAGSGTELSLNRRTGGWREAPPSLERIPLRSMEQNEDLIYAFDTRSVTLVGTDFTSPGTLGFSGSFETVDYSTADMLYLGFNCSSGPCRSPEVRRALSRGLDRDALCAGVFSLHAAPAALPAHPASGVYDKETADRLSYDPQSMADLLRQGGWTNEGEGWRSGRQTLALRLVVNQDNSYKTSAADELGRTFTEAGIAVTVEKLPWEDYLTALETGDFDLYLGETRLTGDFDPALLLNGGALNYGRYTGGGTDVPLAAFQAAQGPARTAAAKVFYGAWAQEAPFAVLCFKNWSVLTQWGQVSGLTPTQQNLFYGFEQWTIRGG